MVKVIYFLFLTVFSLFCYSGSVNAHIDTIELEHVVFSENVQLGGTLTLPNENKANALVIMISGRGPQDRGETLDGFKVFNELSDHLIRSASKSILLAKSSDKPNLTEIDALAEAKAKQLEIIYALPSLTSFLFHDTAKDYERLRVPVLGLFGGKDLQVTIAQNKDRMENALLKSNTAYHFEMFSEANHYFQKAKTGQREEYATLGKHFVDGFTDIVSNWVLEN